MPQWIPIWEQRPEAYVQVLLSYSFYDPSVQETHFYRGAGHYTEDNTFVIYGEDEQMEAFRVVAWQPLPEAAYAVLQCADASACPTATVVSDHALSQLCKAQPSHHQLINALGRAVETLEFYQEVYHYTKLADPDDEAPPAFADGGFKARQCLRDLEPIIEEYL